MVASAANFGAAPTVRAAPARANASRKSVLSLAQSVVSDGSARAHFWAPGVALAPLARRGIIARGGELSWDEADELLSLDIGEEHASMDVHVVDAHTAEVRIRAPDRPGLIRDVTAAFAAGRIAVDSASISTKDGDTADNTFVIKLNGVDFDSADSFHDEDGFECQNMIGRVKSLVVEAVLESWSTTTPPNAAYLAPEDRKVEPTVTATAVDSSLTMPGRCVMVSMEATDRAGLLAATVARLHALGCGVISATVNTKEGVANNQFVIATPEGCSAEKVRLACLEVVN